MKITSKDNVFYKRIKHLAQSPAARKAAGQTLLDGVHLFESAVAAGILPQELILTAGAVQKPAIVLLLEKHPKTKVLFISDALMRDLGITDNPSGFLTLIDCPSPESPPKFCTNSLLLDGVQDPGNVGTLLRTAAAAGVSQVLLSDGCAQVWSPKVLRAGQGAHFALSLFEQRDLADFLQRFQGDSLAAQLEKSESIYNANWTLPTAWIFGAEGQGLRAEIAALSTKKIHIPMVAGVESLNVAAAAAVCLFEQRRRFFKATD